MVKPVKKKASIAFESKKRQKERKKYNKIVADKIAEDDSCKLRLPGCTGKAQGGDHKQKRSPKNYADPDNINPACNHCNFQKELLSKEEAESLGISKSRFTK